MATSTNHKADALWSAELIGWVTLFFGITSGLIIASVNWFKMGKRVKAYLHATTALSIATANALFFQDYLRLSHYLTAITFFTRLIALITLTLCVIVYLYTETRKDNSAFQIQGAAYSFRSGLFAVLLGLICFVLFAVLDNLVFQNRLDSFQSHFYCDVLRTHMSLKEVQASLDDIGTNGLINPEGIIGPNAFQFNPDATPAYFRMVIFNSGDEKVQKALNWKLLGFDDNNKLIWVSVECP